MWLLQLEVLETTKLFELNSEPFLLSSKLSCSRPRKDLPHPAGIRSINAIRTPQTILVGFPKCRRSQTVILYTNEYKMCFYFIVHGQQKATTIKFSPPGLARVCTSHFALSPFAACDKWTLTSCACVTGGSPAVWARMKCYDSPLK